MSENVVRIRERRTLALALLCAALTVAVYILAVQTQAGQRAGDAAIAGGLAQNGPIIQAGARALNLISLTTLAAATILIAAIGLVRGGWQLAVAAGGAILGANVLAQLLKRFVLERPALLDVPDPFGSHNSFPSGHATIAMSVVLALFIVLPEWNNLWLAVAGWLYIALTGIAMIAEGWHRPSDAVGGYLVATFAASVACLFSLWVSNRLLQPSTASLALPDPARRLSRKMVPLGLLMAIAAAVALLGVSAGRGWDALDDNTFDRSFLFGGALVATASASLIAMFLRALAGADLAHPLLAARASDSGDAADDQSPVASRRRMS